MANASTISKFIIEIAPCAQTAYKKLGKVKPSICIAMACVESAYGTSQIMRKNNAFWGQKVGTGRTATKYWSGKFFVAKTKEEYTVGQHTVIKDAFRGYDSPLQGALNYYELLNTKLYSRVKADVDFETQMKQIKLCGYMTSSTEVNSVINLIKKYNLTQYDYANVIEHPAVKQGNPYKRTANLIKRGMKGEDVKWLQWMLNNQGSNLKIDGDFGQLTLTAVLEFQQTHKLHVDGLVGKNTIAELEKTG